MKDIAEIIPTGYESRVSREWLVIMTGMSDRTIRQMIEASEMPIVNIDDGYFVPDMRSQKDRAFMKYYYARESKRARSVMRKLDKFRNYMNTMEGQMELQI